MQWLVCREVCIPGKAHVALDMHVVDHAQPSALTGALGQAIQSLPAPLPAGMKVAVLGGRKDFVLTLTIGHRQDKAEFYPLDADQIANAAPQRVEATADGVRIHVPRTPELTTPTGNFTRRR